MWAHGEGAAHWSGMGEVGWGGSGIGSDGVGSGVHSMHAGALAEEFAGMA